MNSLTSAQRKQLRALAHHLKPVVMVGKQGVTEALLAAVNDALDSHELIKVKFQDFKEDRKALSEQIAQASQSHIAGIIGHVLILYRQQEDEDQPAPQAHGVGASRR